MKMAVKKTSKEHKAGKYPVKWDLTDIYKDENAWNKDYDRAIEIINTFDQFKGKLNNVRSINALIKAVDDGEFSIILNKLFIYAELGSSLDPSEKLYLNMIAKLNRLQVLARTHTAFIDAELFANSQEKRVKFFNSPSLKKYAYSFRRFTDPETVIYSEETNTALAKVRSVFGQSDQIYSILLDADTVKPTIKMPDGSEKTLNDSLFDEIKYGDYKRSFKIKAENLYYSSTKQSIHTFTALLNSKLLEYFAEAQLEKKESTLALALKSNDIEKEIFDKIIETARKMLPDFHRFCEIHKKGLKIDKQYYFDVSGYVSKYNAKISYDDAVDEIKKALAVMGDDYIKVFSEIIESPHVDVYSDKKKREGGFMTSCSNPDILPYILLNYSGYAKEASTVAHEMGHAVYGYLSEHNPSNNMTNNNPSIFTHEIASTNNEFLYYSYMMQHAATKDEKLFYLENILTLINGTVIRQIMYTEFEQYIYGIVESGNALDADILCDKWMELNKEYYGSSVTFSENMRYRWAAIPHFYYGYYVYKYATSATYSAIISRHILSGDKKVTDNYKKMLTKGSSEKPSELLKEVGINVLDAKPYKDMVRYYKDLVDTYAELIG